MYWYPNQIEDDYGLPTQGPPVLTVNGPGRAPAPPGMPPAPQSPGESALGLGAGEPIPSYGLDLPEMGWRRTGNEEVDWTPEPVQPPPAEDPGAASTYDRLPATAKNEPVKSDKGTDFGEIAARLGDFATELQNIGGLKRSYAHGGGVPNAQSNYLERYRARKAAKEDREYQLQARDPNSDLSKRQVKGVERVIGVPAGTLDGWSAQEIAGYGTNYLALRNAALLKRAELGQRLKIEQAKVGREQAKARGMVETAQKLYPKAAGALGPDSPGDAAKIVASDGRAKTMAAVNAAHREDAAEKDRQLRKDLFELAQQGKIDMQQLVHGLKLSELEVKRTVASEEREEKEERRLSATIELPDGSVIAPSSSATDDDIKQVKGAAQLYKGAVKMTDRIASAMDDYAKSGTMTQAVDTAAGFFGEHGAAARSPELQRVMTPVSLFLTKVSQMTGQGAMSDDERNNAITNIFGSPGNMVSLMRDNPQTAIGLLRDYVDIEFESAVGPYQWKEVSPGGAREPRSAETPATRPSPRRPTAATPATPRAPRAKPAQGDGSEGVIVLGNGREIPDTPSNRAKLEEAKRQDPSLTWTTR